MCNARTVGTDQYRRGHAGCSNVMHHPMEEAGMEHRGSVDSRHDDEEERRCG
jgi:hypothetical protein